MPDNQTMNSSIMLDVGNPATLKDRVASFQSFLANAKQKKITESVSKSDATQKELAVSGMNSTNDTVSKECNRGIKYKQVADGIRDEYKYQIDLSDPYWQNDANVVDSYLYNHKNDEKTLYDYVTNDADTSCDPTGLYNTMGWFQTEEEDKGENILLNILKNFEAPFRIAGKGIRNTLYSIENMGYDLADAVGIDSLMGRDLQQEKINNQKGNALREYTLDSQTDFGLTYSDEDLDRAAEDVYNNPELLDEYINGQNVLNGVVSTAGGGIWGLGAYTNPIGAIINGAISTGIETPYLKNAIELGLLPISLIGELGDWALTSTPGVNKIWEKLDETSQELVKFYIGGKVTGYALLKKNPKTGKLILRKYPQKVLDWVKEAINKYKSNKTQDTTLTERGLNLKNSELATRSSEELKNLDRKSNKIVNVDTVAENRDITKALLQLEKDSLKNVKTYEDLFKTNEKEVKRIEQQENELVETIPDRWGPEEDVWDVEVTSEDGKYIGEGEPNHPIREFIEKMEIMTKDSSSLFRKAVNVIKQKYENGDITAADLLRFKRALSTQFNLYRYGKEGKELKVSKTEIETIRRGLNYLLRSKFDRIPEFKEAGLGNIFETLDERWSPNLNLRSRLIDLVNKVNKLRGQIPEGAWKKEVGDAMGKATSIKGLLGILLNRLSGNGKKMTNALDFEGNLKSSIKSFIKLMKNVPDTQKGLIDSALTEYFKRKSSGPREVYGGKVEGEVIEPDLFGDFVDFENEAGRNRYLEDYVQVVEPDAPGYNTLEGNPAVGPDLQTPIRVTPEGYAGRMGQIIESYKNTLKESGFSERQIDKVIDILEENYAKNAKQKSLFE